MLKKLLSTPTEQLGKMSRFAVFQIKLWSHCAHLLRKNRSGQQAAALAYYSIFGVVPLVILMLLVFQSFPAYSEIGDKVKNFVYEELNLSTIVYQQSGGGQDEVMLTDYLDEVSQRFFTGMGKGSITLVSVMIVIYAAFALLSTIERSFNNIWHLSTGRSFLNRIINYWALVTLGPLLIGVGIFVTTRYAMVGMIQETVVSYLAPPVVSYLIATVVFFLLYFILPNTKVQAGSAIWGAAVAALAWSLAKWVFGIYVTEFIPYSKVYGVMGLVPLGVFWIFVMWLIVLFGLNLTFTTQHLRSLDSAEILSSKKREEYFIADEFTVINMVSKIADAFERNQAPISADVIYNELNIPADFGQKIMGRLVDSGIIVKSSEPREGFMPAKEPENIKLSDITEVVTKAGFSQPERTKAGKVREIQGSVGEMLSKYNLKQVIKQKEEKEL